jgi:hypothetical protein
VGLLGFQPNPPVVSLLPAFHYISSRGDVGVKHACRVENERPSEYFSDGLLLLDFQIIILHSSFTLLLAVT